MANVSLTINDLKVGHYINLPIGWTSHPFILNSFIIKDEKQLQLLRHLGLNTIAVDLSRSKIAQEQTITPVTTPTNLADAHQSRTANELALAEKLANQKHTELLAQQAILKEKSEQQIQLTQQQVWWKEIRHARSKYQDKIATIKDIYSKLSLQPDNAINLLGALTGELIIAAEQQHDFSFVLCNEELSSDSLYQNAMNVAVLSTRLAQQLSFDAQDVVLVAQAAILSQYGMLWVPASIRNKKSELTKPEINYLKQHPAYTGQKLQDTSALSDVVINTILQINEKFDGSGYPRGIKQDKISKYAQLIAIATRYNDMCNANLPQHRYSPHLAIGLLFKVAGKHYNKTYLEQFIKMMGIYPVGTIVSHAGNLAQVQIGIVDSLRQPLIMDFNEIEPIKKQPLLSHCGEKNITISTGISCNDVDQGHIAQFNLIQRSNLYFPS